jgi:hypothetical protein
VTAIPDDVVLDIAITQLHGIVVGNDLLVIADAAAQIANPGREAHLWNWRLVGTGPYKRIGDLSDLNVKDHNGHALAYDISRTRRGGSAAKLLTKDEAQRMAANFR